MSSPDFLDVRKSETLYERLSLPYSSTPLGSYLAVGIIGAGVLFKALELLGYPLWLWLHRLIEMTAGLVPSSFPPTSNGMATNDDTQKTDMQRSGGNMLSSVFGLNSSGLLGKGVRGVTGALSKSYSSVPPGLGNWDNSCYQNSVIQGLASLPSLREYLSKTVTEYNALGAETTSASLFDMIKKLNDPANHGQHFWIRGNLKSMSTFQQQDAQEYYSKILDALDKEVQNASSSKRQSTASWLHTVESLNNLPVETAAGKTDKNQEEQEDDSPQAEKPHVVPNPLDGLLAQRVGCMTCGYTEGLSMIPFNCITVPLGRNYSYDVRECLDEYTSLEPIEGVECAKCTLLKTKNTLIKLVGPKPEANLVLAARLDAVQEALDEEDFDDKTLIKKCGVAKKNWVQSTKSRQAVIARAPKSLVLHVNRSIFDEMTGMMYKNTANVAYSKFLDLGYWCLGSRPSRSQQPDDSIEEWPRDPTKSMLGDWDTQPSAESPFQYVLRAAVTHFGSHGNGHYICYRPHPVQTTDTTGPPFADSAANDVGEKWWRFSDENVTDIPEEMALNQKGVFMFFYERIDQTKAPLPTPEAGVVQSSMPVVSEETLLPPVQADEMGPGAAISDIATRIPLPDDDEDSFLPSPPESPPLQSYAPDTAFESFKLEEEYVSGKQHAEHSTIAAATRYPTPPPDMPITSTQSDVEISEADTANYDSDDAPSTQMTSDDDGEVDPRQFIKDQIIARQNHPASPGPHLMRTAGDVTRSEDVGNSRTGLPMVTAT